MSRFVIRNLRSVRAPPLTETTSTNITGYAPVAGRKARIPAKGEAKPPPKVSPLVTPPFFPPCDAKVHKGIRLGRAEGLREDPQKGTSQPYESKSKGLVDVISDRKSAKDRQGTDRPKNKSSKVRSPHPNHQCKEGQNPEFNTQKGTLFMQKPPPITPKRSGLNGIV